jgi:acetyl-CoA synthetase
MNTSEVYPIPEQLSNNEPHVAGRSHYHRLYEESISQMPVFWDRMAKQEMRWIRPFEQVMNGSVENGDLAWFLGGTLNASVNCVDRHLETRGKKVALIWEQDEPGKAEHITYHQLFIAVNKFANMLKEEGVKKGDRVVIYMPMIPEAVYAMLACARIGAIHSVVFAGFSSDALLDRIVDAGARVVVTSNISLRGGKQIPLKELVDVALSKSNPVESVLVHQRVEKETPMKNGRDKWIHTLLPKYRPYCAPEEMDSEDPLFMLYTSGSTGKPKGLVHTTAGYLLYSGLSHKYVFDVHEKDVYGCMADIGWITGHSYVVYGPLFNGSTTVLFESIPTYPNYSRYWDLVQRHKLTQFYTSPTALRTLMRSGTEPLEGFDLSSLRVLGSVGEPINPEVWKWFYKNVGKEKCAVVDTMWQSETGGIVVSPLPGATPMKPGSCTLPFFGIQLQLLDPVSGKVQTDISASGLLTISAPWPGIARTIWNDHQRYLDTYFSTHKGYFVFGDGAMRDKDGYYWITGRVDDVINKAGHRLGTSEIESALVSWEGCTEAAVVGIDDYEKGSAIVAFCTIKSTTAENQETIKLLKSTVATHIGKIAQPDIIILTSALPKTRSGKIMRRLLRKIASGDISNLGDISTLAEPHVVDELIEKMKRHGKK